MEPRSKQACEPCRKKKSKCTGEKPTCSFCQRLNQDCTYKTTEPKRTNTKRSGRVNKNAYPSDLRDRFQLLESQVKGIYELLERQTETVSRSSPNTSARPISVDSYESATNMSPEIISETIPEATFSPDNSVPSSDALDHLIEVYRIRHHLQPLLLFKLPDLKIYLHSAPRYLLHSFLALTVRHSRHAFYQGQQAQAIEFYASSAQQTVTRLASQGIPRLEIIQSLCLLVLVDVAACKPGQAWMTIGTLSRLEALRKISQPALIESLSDLEASLGCHWTVFLLEQTFTPLERSSIQDDNEPRYPTSAPIPPSLPPVSDGEYPPDLFSEDASEDLGITAYYVKILGIWGNLSSYLHQIRIGKVGNAWSPGSMHYTICAQLYEYDSKTPHIHLLRSVHFTKRQSHDLIERREYWIPWVLQQVTSHATNAILNHPFIHLVAMRDRMNGLPPRQFLQQTVDLTLYHSAWVFKFLRFCDENNIGIYDPLVGHLVAVVATIPWLFQRAIDQKIALKAKDDFAWCKEFLQSLSTTWPHIGHKLELLKSLDSIAENNPQSPTSKGISIVFHPHVFWSLVDPKLSQITPSVSYSQGINLSQDGTIRVSTHYIQPLVDIQAQQSSIVGDTYDPFPLDLGALEQINLDDVFASFLPTLDETDL